jgi:hypothetical protein
MSIHSQSDRAPSAYDRQTSMISAVMTDCQAGGQLSRPRNSNKFHPFGSGCAVLLILLQSNPPTGGPCHEPHELQLQERREEHRECQLCPGLEGLEVADLGST